MQVKKNQLWIAKKPYHGELHIIEILKKVGDKWQIKYLGSKRNGNHRLTSWMIERNFKPLDKKDEEMLDKIMQMYAESVLKRTSIKVEENGSL